MGWDSYYINYIFVFCKRKLNEMKAFFVEEVCERSLAFLGLNWGVYVVPPMHAILISLMEIHQLKNFQIHLFVERICFLANWKEKEKKALNVKSSFHELKIWKFSYLFLEVIGPLTEWKGLRALIFNCFYKESDLKRKCTHEIHFSASSEISINWRT